MRGHTRSAAVVVVAVFLAGALSTSCSDGDRYVSLEICFVERTPADTLTEMAMKVWGGHKTYFAHHRVLLTERDVSTATVVTRNGAPAIELVFAGDAREKLLRLTRNNVGRTLGIIIDGELQSTSDIDAPIDNGTVVVTGHMLEYGAKRCSRALMRQVTGT